MDGEKRFSKTINLRTKEDKQCLAGLSARGLRGFGSRFGDKCLEREIRRGEESSPFQRLRPRLPVVESALRAEKQFTLKAANSITRQNVLKA